MDELLKKLARLVLNNRGIKLASLAAALMAWYAIRVAISHETLVKDVPLTIQVDEGWVAMNWKVKTVDVLFRGAQEDIRNLDRNQIRVEVDLRKRTTPGLKRIRLEARHVLSPGGARPVYIQPAEISITLDQMAEKRVPVKAEFQGSVLEDFDVVQAVCEPDSLLLYGPRQRLERMALLHTAPIDLEGRSRSFRKTHVELALPGETQLARGATTNLTVVVTIAEHLAHKTFQSMPVMSLLPPGTDGSIDLTPDQVNLTLRARAELLNGLNRDSLRVYVDAAGLAPGQSTNLPVRAFVPVGVEISAIEPASLLVRMRGARQPDLEPAARKR